MISNYGIVTLLSVSLLTAGCATVDKTALSPEWKKKIKTVAVISVPEPEKYFLNPGQAPGGAALYVFGALGGLILGGIEASRAETATNEFTAAVKPTKPDVAQHWNDSVLALLQSKGYAVTQVPALLTKADGKQVDCTSVVGKFDAVFLSSISTGYAVESAVEPRVIATVKLMSENCAETIYSDAYLYSAQPIGKLTHIERDAQFSFSSRDALIADPQKAREGLRKGLTVIANRATSEL